MNGKDMLRLKAQIAIAAFALLAMTIFIVAGVDCPQSFSAFTWAINGELFLEGGAKWGSQKIKQLKEQK